MLDVFVRQWTKSRRNRLVYFSSHFQDIDERNASIKNDVLWCVNCSRMAYNNNNNNNNNNIHICIAPYGRNFRGEAMFYCPHLHKA